MERTQIVSPKGVAVFPRLSKPDTKFNAQGEYSLRLKLDTNDAQVRAFIEGLEDAAAAAFDWATHLLNEKLDAAKTPQKKGELKKKIETLAHAKFPVKPVLDEEGNETRFAEIRFKANAQFTGKDGEVVRTRPVLKGPKRETLDADKVMVGGGSIVRVAALMYPYYSDKDNVAGIAFRLKATQVLELRNSDAGDDFGFDEEDAELNIADASSAAGSDSDDF